MAAKKPSNKKLGRRPQHWARPLRVLVWYRFVRSRSDLSDSELNARYEAEENSEAEFVFERLRRSLSMRGKPSKGKTPNLVRFAERLAPGSLYLYEDPIWETLEQPPQTLMEINQAINDFFIRNHIVRLFPEQAADFALKLNIRDQISLYRRSLDDLLRRLNCWARLHLLGLLCREADMAGNTEITELTRSLFDHHVQHVLFSELHSDEADNYYNVFINDFLFSKRQSGVSEGAFREGLEGIVERPLRFAFEMSQ